eukprot:2532410-Lingulodinium_polyedra.AAC.1
MRAQDSGVRVESAGVRFASCCGGGRSIRPKQAIPEPPRAIPEPSPGRPRAICGLHPQRGHRI